MSWLPLSSTRAPRHAVITAALVLAAASPAPLAAQQGACALLTMAEVRTLLGPGAPEGAGNGRTCRWGTVKSGPALIVITYQGMPAAALTAMRRSMLDEAESPADEPTVAAAATSALTDFGVVLVAPKGDKLLQLQYHLGRTGTPADRAPLRAAARAAYARY